MKIYFYTLTALIISINAMAQTSKKQQDREVIKKMCGCYEVTFNFAETFHYSSDSLYKPSINKMDKALEWAQLITDEENTLSIQHLLQVGNPAAPMIIKHWRQDWLFENKELYTYNADNTWQYSKLSNADVKGQWTQKVYQVDDSPRYEGSSTWVHVDGKSYWENTSDAPLPRREYTTRSDYNLTIRGNRQEITEYGWLHDQDNAKVIREMGTKDIVIANEKGYNTYVKVPDSRCAAAAKWWRANDSKWELVRNKWNEVYARRQDLTLEERVENKPLFKFLLDEEAPYNNEGEINTLIERFVKN